MTKNIKYILILALLGVACAVSWNVYFKVYTQTDTVSIHSFPKQIGQWKS